MFAIKAAHATYKERRRTLKKAEANLRKLQNRLDYADDAFGNVEEPYDSGIDRSGDWHRYDRYTRDMLYDDARERRRYYAARDRLDAAREDEAEGRKVVRSWKASAALPQRFATAATVLPRALPEDLVREVLLFAFVGAKMWYADGDAAVIAAAAPHQAAAAVAEAAAAAVEPAPVAKKAKNVKKPIAAKAPRKKAPVKPPRAAVIKKPSSKVLSKQAR